MAWRNAKSLDALKSEVQAKAPGTTIWTLGDAAHQASWSDHNPNAAGVVCAADILGDAGLDLRWLADTIVANDPPALKYVIYQDRIWFPGNGWGSYGGEYHTHVHVSVGWGPDGQSTGPYDDTSPWLSSQPSPMQGDEEEVKLFKVINDDKIWASNGMRRRHLGSWALVEQVYGQNPAIIEVGSFGELEDAAGPVDGQGGTANAVVAPESLAAVTEAAKAGAARALNGVTFQAKA